MNKQTISNQLWTAKESWYRLYFTLWQHWENTKSLKLLSTRRFSCWKTNLNILHKFLRKSLPVKTLTYPRQDCAGAWNQKRDQANFWKFCFCRGFNGNSRSLLEKCQWLPFSQLVNVSPRQTQVACLVFPVPTPAEST